MSGFRQTVIPWRRSWHGSISDCFPGPFYIMLRSVAEAPGREPPCVASKVCQLGESADRFAHVRHATLLLAIVFVLLPMLSGEIYLRLKTYWVVKISTDIVTEHCFRVCILSMIFAAPTAGWVLACVVSDCAIKVPRCLISLRQTNVKIFFTFFSHFSLTETHPC